MSKVFPRVRVRYPANAIRQQIWEARVIHHEDDKGAYLVGDFGPISYKWIAKRFLAKYPSAKAPDMRKWL